EITYVPGLYKIVDEILVNAADNKKVSGGRNGFGAKLANIFNTEIILETVSNGKKYLQTFRNNMIVIEQPILTTSYDLAGCVKAVQKFLNNEQLNFNNFKEYMQLYVSDREDLQSSLVYDKCDDRWEIGAFLLLILNSI
ncbi:5526_t:CDS:2, partial [Funneliformis mosseae]